MKDLQFIEKAIDWAKKHGFKTLKANAEGYETPTKFILQEGKQSFVPDITAIHLGGKNYIEIASKTENVNRSVSKWKLLSTLANKKGGKFFLLAPKGHKYFTEKLVEQYNLSAEVVYLK